MGEWTASENALDRKWEGTGFPCVTCYRIWGVTDPHPRTKGICPYVCEAAFAPGRAPSGCRPPTDRTDPTVFLQTANLTPPVAITPAAPSAPTPPAVPAQASAMHIRVPPQDFPVASVQPASGGAADKATFGNSDSDDDWPAFRETPPKMAWRVPNGGATDPPPGK